jgi:hypothetical protein
MVTSLSAMTRLKYFDVAPAKAIIPSVFNDFFRSEASPSG